MTPQEAHDYIEGLRKKYSSKKGSTQITAFNYWAKVERLVDGDTIHLEVDLGFTVSVRETFRLLGVNTPEKYGVKKDSEEYKRGVAASEFVANKLPEDGWIEIEVYKDKKGKYGRWLCMVFINGENINESLLANGHAEPMDF